jgi:F-type H+-transporting ATPase subunit gamma
MHIIAMVGLHRLKKKASKRYYHLFIIKELFKGAKIRDDEDVISVNEINTGDYETDQLANNIEQFVIVYISSDRSCSGLINGGIFKAVKAIVTAIKNQYKTVRIVCIGKKGFRALRSLFRYDFYKVFLDIDMEKNSFAICYVIVYKIMKLEFEKGLLLFNKFIDIQVQIVSYYRFFSFTFLFKKIFYEQHKNKFFRRLTTLNKVDDYSLLDFYRFSMTLLILDALKENSFSEIACRARAMETIMQNLDVLINHF